MKCLLLLFVDSLLNFVRRYSVTHLFYSLEDRHVSREIKGKQTKGITGSDAATRVVENNRFGEKSLPSNERDSDLRCCLSIDGDAS